MPLGAGEGWRDSGLAAFSRSGLTGHLTYAMVCRPLAAVADGLRLSCEFFFAPFASSPLGNRGHLGGVTL